MKHQPSCVAPRFTPHPLALLVRQCLGAGLTVAAVGATAQTSLKEVVVTDQSVAIGGLQKTYAGGQFARGGDLGILGRTDMMDVPFSTTNYTSELIDNQQGLTVSDVVMNDASVRSLTSRGGFGDGFQIRGFGVGNEDISLNGLYGLAPMTRLPLEMIERVEVLKGPGALTNGVGPSGSVGGTINVATKRAADAPLTRLTGTYMGKSQFGTHLDVGRRFGTDNQWGMRVNGVWRNGEGNVDDGRQRLGLASLGVDYAGERLRWSLDAFTSRSKTREFRPQIGFRAGITALPAVPDSRLNIYPGTELTDGVKTVMSRLEYDLNTSTTVYGAVGYSDSWGNQHFPGSWGAEPDSLGNFAVGNGYYDAYNKTSSAEMGIRTRLKTGNVNHTLVLSANQMNQEIGYFYASTAYVPSNLYQPTPLPAITTPRGTPSRSSELAQHSIAVADTMGLFNDRLLVTLGLRDQTVHQKSVNGSTAYKASSVTPLAGVVFKPVDHVSIYANYTAGLTKGDIAAPGYANAGATFAPQKSKQQEVGVKVDWGRMVTQAALFQIKRPGSMVENNVFSFGGEQRNRGLELTAYGELQRGLRLMASAAFNSSKLTRTANGVNAGNEVTGVPDRTFNLGLDWDTPVQGVSLNGRVIHTSSMYADASNANQLRAPGWTRLDLGARYTTKVSGKPVVLRANLENVTDKRYWVISNYATVGAPRTLMLSAQVDF